MLIDKKVFQVNPQDPLGMKKISAKITGLIAKHALKAHKLVTKISNTFKHKLTKLGQSICYKVLKFKKIELV